MNLLFAPEASPFLVAAIAVLVIGVIEGLAILIGVSVSEWFDHVLPDFHADASDTIAEKLLGWLYIGRAPALALLIAFLTFFAVAGLTLQMIFGSIFGHYAPAWLASVVAMIPTLPAMRVTGRLLTKLVPQDQSSAVSDESLVGRIATVVIGVAKVGKPTQARVSDQHGTTHYVMIEPDDESVSLAQGDSVLLVRQISGRRFHAIPNPKPDIL